MLLKEMLIHKGKLQKFSFALSTALGCIYLDRDPHFIFEKRKKGSQSMPGDFSVDSVLISGYRESEIVGFYIGWIGLQRSFVRTGLNQTRLLSGLCSVRCVYFRVSCFIVCVATTRNSVLYTSKFSSRNRLEFFVFYLFIGGRTRGYFNDFF